MNQDPYLLYTGTLQLSGPALISLSPDGRTVAIAQDASIYVCNSSGNDAKLIENVHSGMSSWFIPGMWTLNFTQLGIMGVIKGV